MVPGTSISFAFFHWLYSCVNFIACPFFNIHSGKCFIILPCAYLLQKFIFQPGQGVRKVRPNNKRGLVTIKTGNNSKKTDKVKEEVIKLAGQTKADGKKDSQGQVKDQKVAQETVSEKPGGKKVENERTKQEEEVI